MDRVPQKVLAWLHDILLNGYRDVNATYYDVANALGQFPQFRVKTETYTFDNGHSALLLRLNGQISAQHRGNTYQYPVCIWVPYEYPSWPPISYVLPSQGINVRPNQHVGVDGKIYHPYFGEGWQPGRFNIVGILNVLGEIFAHEPPLAAARSPAPPIPPVPGSVSRSESLRSQQVASPRQSLAPALPPKPGQQRPPSIASPPAVGQGPPPRPPKPGDAAASPVAAGYYDQAHQRPGSVSGRPPLPPQQPFSPQGYQQGQPPPQHWQQGPQPQRPPQNWQQGPPQPGPPQQLPNQQQQQFSSPPPTSLPQQQGRQALQPGQPQHPPHYQPSHPSQGHPGPAPQQWHQPPTRQQQPPVSRQPEDLLTSPFDVPLPTHTDTSNLPVPPVPPNPEKDALLHAISQSLHAQLNQSLQSNANALPALQAQHHALSSALSNLQQEFAHLRALEAQVKANESTLHSSLQEADTAIADAKQRPVPNIDETLIAPTVLSNQLYNLVAEEKSCVAAREVLGSGLDRGRLGAEQWVKSVRGVAREEWLKKYLVKRAALGMGLAGVSMGGGARDEEEKEVAATGGEDEMSYYR